MEPASGNDNVRLSRHRHLQLGVHRHLHSALPSLHPPVLTLISSILESCTLNPNLKPASRGRSMPCAGKTRARVTPRARAPQPRVGGERAKPRHAEGQAGSTHREVSKSGALQRALLICSRIRSSCTARLRVSSQRHVTRCSLRRPALLPLLTFSLLAVRATARSSYSCTPRASRLGFGFGI